MGTSRAVTRRDPGVRYPHYPPTRRLGAWVLSKQLLNVHNRGKEDGSKKCCLCGVLSKAPEHFWARWPAQADRTGRSTRRRSREALRRRTGARGPESEHGDAGPACSIPASSAIASDTTGPQRQRTAEPRDLRTPCPAPRSLNPGLHAPTGTQAHHNTSGPARRSETHEASPDSVRHRCLNILLALANPRCARALAALRHLAGARTPWQDPEVERRGRAGGKRRRPKGLRRSHADRHAMTSRWRSQTLATLGPSLRSGPRNARRLNNGGVKRGGAGGRKDGKQAGWPRHRKARRPRLWV